MPKKQLPQLSGSRVPQFVLDKVDDLLKKVGPLGHPRATKEDVVGALIDATTPAKAAKALNAYNPKLGEALAELAEDEGSESEPG